MLYQYSDTTFCYKVSSVFWYNILFYYILFRLGLGLGLGFYTHFFFTNEAHVRFFLFELITLDVNAISFSLFFSISCTSER